MARKSSSFGGVLLIGLVIAIGAIAEAASEQLTVILIIGAIVVVGIVVAKVGSASGTRRGRQETEAAGLAEGHWGHHKALSTDGDAFWVPSGETAERRGVKLGGMLYVGSGLASIQGGEVEPALINPDLPVDATVSDCTFRRLPYWPSYTGASAGARAAYLRWLHTGRRDIAADIGYVFLYFYGLERRALYDARLSAAAATELSEIEQEVERLLQLYGGQRSFDRYANALIDFLTARRLPPRLYLSEPRGRTGRALGFSDRLALAQCAADGHPLPPAWAHFWITSHGAANLGVTPRRCPVEFRKLFEMHYRATFGDGLTLPKNRTLLKLDYRPASPSFGPRGEDLTLELDLPDISVLTSPVRKLEEIALQACRELEKYSRVVSKDPAAAQSFEALVELPASLWPAQYREPIESVRDVVLRAGKPAAIPLEKFRSWLPGWSELTKPKARALSRALAAVGLGMEPDVRFGGSVPALDSRVVLFADDGESAAPEPTPRYMAAALTLHLAAAVATADGDTADAEKGLLLRQLEEWLALTESERRRLHAHLRLLLSAPPKLTGLTKRIDELDRGARDALADFLALVAQADAKVTAEEIKTLQKIFKLLGLPAESVFSKVHVAATESVALNTNEPARGDHGFSIPKPALQGRTAAAPSSGLKLDAAKITALQRDSERVASILATVFDSPAEGVESVADVIAPEEVPEPGLLGLDAIHSALLETLLARTHWSRAELEELAGDRGLMLDGALEHINEACFEKLDMALLEGTDPVELDADAVRGILGDNNQES